MTYPWNVRNKSDQHRSGYLSPVTLDLAHTNVLCREVDSVFCSLDSLPLSINDALSWF